MQMEGCFKYKTVSWAPPPQILQQPFVEFVSRREVFLVKRIGIISSNQEVMCISQKVIRHQLYAFMRRCFIHLVYCSILGHKNRKPTESYLHSVDESERKVMQKPENVHIILTPLPDNGGRPTNMHREYRLLKEKRPDYQSLCKEIKNLVYVGTGKKYDVSDNAVRKWKKYYESQFEN